MEQTIYKVETASFEGPIELLLRLIEARKLPINEISIARVTDDYIQSIQSIAQVGLSNVTQFVVVASTLVLIKSRTLLPLLQLTEEEEGNIDDLERRLKVYKLFQDLGITVGEQFMKRQVFPREYVSRGVVFSPDKKITTEALHDSLASVLATIPEKEVLPEKRVKTVIHIEDLMDRLVERIETGIATSFNQFVAKKEHYATKEEYQEAKIYAVVGFLAMLEMVRNGIIAVIQDQTFQDIHMEKAS